MDLKDDLKYTWFKIKDSFIFQFITFMLFLYGLFLLLPVILWAIYKVLETGKNIAAFQWNYWLFGL